MRARLAIRLVLVLIAAFAWTAAAEARDPVRSRLERINLQVNGAHRWGSRLSADWVDGVYDCENFAFSKKALLPDLKSRVLEVDDETGARHAVLAVDSTDGEWILDNRFAWPQRREVLVAYGYRFSNREMIDPTLGPQALWIAVFRATEPAAP